MSSEDIATYNQMEHSFCKRISVICKLMVPLSFGILLDSAILMANLIYAGRLNSNDLAAVGLSQSFCYLLMVSLVCGIGSSLDTLMSQEYGASNFDNCAMYYNKTAFLTIVLSVLFYPLFYFSEEVLVFIGVDSNVAHITQNFLVIYYWEAVLYIQCNNIKMQLRVQRIVWPSLAGSIICLGSYFALMEGLITIYGPSYQLIAIVNTSSYVIQFSFLLTLILCGVGEPRARRCIRCSDLKNWSQYCKIAIPSVLLQMVEGWNFELVTLIVATFNPIQLAAQNIVGNLSSIYFIFTAFGTATSLSIIIGNAMGMKMVSLAKIVMREMLVIGVILGIIFSGGFLIFRSEVIKLFTNDTEVIEATNPAFIAMSVAQFIDIVSWVAIGVLKGLGKIRWLPLFQLVCYYFVHQPISILLIHFLQLGFQTYWRVLIGAIAGIAAANYIYLSTLNWHKVADEIEERGVKEQLNNMEKDSNMSAPLL